MRHDASRVRRTIGSLGTLCALAALASGCDSESGIVVLADFDAARFETDAGPPATPDAFRAMPMPGYDGGPVAMMGLREADPCAGGCVVDGACLRSGEAVPGRPCFVCDGSSAPGAVVPQDGAHCDDGAFCTVSDACVDGECRGVPRDCSDGIACTTGDACDEAAGACVAGTVACGDGEVCDVESGSCAATCAGCVVDGVCVAAGGTLHDDPCSACDPAWSTTSLRPMDGTSCDDGAFCTVSDRCDAGVCSGTPRDCSDGIACTGVERCDEDADACTTGDATCGPGTACDVVADVCASTCAGCFVDGVCFADGTRGSDPCWVCDVSRASDRLSPNDGHVCDDGWFCTVDDTCSAGACFGAPRPCDDEVACDGPETCDEASAHCVPGVPTCVGMLCDVRTDACVWSCDGCTISDVCYPDGTPSPTDPCLRCDVVADPYEWSPADGEPCDDGDVCTIDDACSAGTCGGGVAWACSDGTVCGLDCIEDCTDGCVIEGVCWRRGSAHPTLPCLACDPDADRGAWSGTTGAPCDDGAFCTVDDVCVGAECRGSERDCSDGVVCNGYETCDESSDACVDGTSTCDPTTEVCDPVENECVPRP